MAVVQFRDHHRPHDGRLCRLRPGLDRLDQRGVITTIGFALTVGVLADAFLVRMLLVPAFISLVGERMWWLPAWLDRLLPNVDIEGQALLARLEGYEPDPDPRVSVLA